MPATYHFYMRKDRKNKQGLCPVYLRITHDRKKKYLNTGIKIPPGDWHEDNEKVRRSHSTYKKLNQDLEILKEKAQQAHRELDRANKASAEAIRARLQGASRDNFFTLSDEYIKRLRYEKKYHSQKQCKVSFKKLKQFHGSDDLPLSMVDVSFLDKFQSYLMNEHQNKPSTIRKNFGAIRAVLDQATDDHLISGNPLDSARFKLIKNNKPAYKAKLNIEQIKALENVKCKKGSNRWHARNAFVLAFYFCGMRFGDVATLKWKNVRDGRLRYQMSKTGTPVNIKIPEGAKAILNYYDSKDRKEDDFILPFLNKLSKHQQKDEMIVKRKVSSANVIVNDRLKKVAKQARINETLSMHVARHSFAQYGVDIKEIPTYKMMQLLGHQNIKTTQNYLKTISVKTVDAAIDEIFN
ncbi:MAG TPA: site-specific integrase [Balneolaceae bacterium]|nr:site-specific integrase [Balneolaceae bacterium]